MNMKFKVIASVSALALIMSASFAPAATVESTTTTRQAPYPGGKTINLNNFDLNKDNMLSSYEVSEMLFKLFDTDTSGAIEPAEFDFRSVLTVAPMEKTTAWSYDYDNDGVADNTQYTFQTFTQDTQLARFDQNKDGLSPHEFVDKTLAAIDTDGNNRIDLTEWRTAYMARILEGKSH